MSKQVQRRRGTAEQHESFIGASGEITVDLTNKTLRVHDGSTVGGTQLATVGDLGEHIEDTNNPHTVTKAQIGLGNVLNVEQLPVFDNAGAHNAIYRGKNLGTAVTPEQWDAIDDGSFRDLYPGDYWTINGTIYRIAHINYYRNSGDSNVPPNHLTIVPDVAFYDHAMNDTNITTGGWTGSKMFTEGLTEARNKINTDFSGHVVTLRKYLCNAVTDGKASAAAWTDVDIDLMNEIMVYGTITCGESIPGALNRNVGTEKSQLALFQHQPDLIINKIHNILLKDVVSVTHFATVNSNGVATAIGATTASGVLPVFSIKK